ncbi:MAG: UDP-N-acetylmuramate dehydrogenase [Chlorobiaceae bacterium]|nr:UDP-N-acetylmuramate dehydrogenase [Chlorobiaceae bacterium]
MPELSPPCFFESDVQLSQKAYYGIGGEARFVAYPGYPSELADLLIWNRENRLPLALMGAGSNILFSGMPFPGVVISLKNMNRMFWISDDELFCGAGVENTAIAEELLRCGRSGGEWLYRLPGQIGATVRMNARCFGGEVSEHTSGILSVSVDGRMRRLAAEQVFHGYKHTSLMENPEIVTAVLLRFPDIRPKHEIEELMRKNERERLEKHHFDYPSCGSTFKNNYTAGRSSGKIFDELGFRGEREGGAEVSQYHANFIYNRQKATAEDVLRLAARMRSAAFEKAGVQLDLEVQCIGLFDRGLLDDCGVEYTPDPDDASRGWTGLLWSHDSMVPAETYPSMLLQGPMTGYFGTDHEYPSGVFAQVEQLVSLEDAESSPDLPFLRWTSRIFNFDAFKVKPSESLKKGAFLDGLWQFSVSELFISDGDRRNGYLEFEMTPQGQWVALRFDSPRKRASGYEILSAEPWIEHLGFLQDDAGFGMEFSYELLRPFIREGSLAMQCCASSGGGQYGLFPWWNEPEKPADFHQPGKFFRIQLS